MNHNIKILPARLPEDAVEEAFENLTDNISADAQPIIDYMYFEDTSENVLSVAFIFGILICITALYKSFLGPKKPKTKQNIEIRLASWIPVSYWGLSSQHLEIIIRTLDHGKLVTKLFNPIDVEIVPDVFLHIDVIVENYNNRYAMYYLCGIVYNVTSEFIEKQNEMYDTKTLTFSLHHYWRAYVMFPL